MDWRFYVSDFVGNGKNVSSFGGALVHAYIKADLDNRRRLAMGFPELAQEVDLAWDMGHENYLQMVTRSGPGGYSEIWRW